MKLGRPLKMNSTSPEDNHLPFMKQIHIQIELQT